MGGFGEELAHETSWFLECGKLRFFTIWIISTGLHHLWHVSCKTNIDNLSRIGEKLLIRIMRCRGTDADRSSCRRLTGSICILLFSFEFRRVRRDVKGRIELLCITSQCTSDIVAIALGSDSKADSLVANRRLIRPHLQVLAFAPTLEFNSANPCYCLTITAYIKDKLGF